MASNWASTKFDSCRFELEQKRTHYLSTMRIFFDRMTGDAMRALIHALYVYADTTIKYDVRLASGDVAKIEAIFARWCTFATLLVFPLIAHYTGSAVELQSLRVPAIHESIHDFFGDGNQAEPWNVWTYMVRIDQEADGVSHGFTDQNLAAVLDDFILSEHINSFWEAGIDGVFAARRERAIGVCRELAPLYLPEDIVHLVGQCVDDTLPPHTHVYR